MSGSISLSRHDPPCSQGWPRPRGNLVFGFYLAAEVTEINQLKFELIGILKIPRKSTHLKQNCFVFRHREGQESGILGF